MVAAERIKEFLIALGITEISERETDEGNWLQASCPLAPWKHASGVDRHPSFGVRIPTKEGESPYFHCFACNSGGSLPRLIHNLQMLSGEHYSEATQILLSMDLGEGDDKLSVDTGKIRKRVRVDKFADYEERLNNTQTRKALPVPENILAGFPSLSVDNDETHYVRRWLIEERGVSEQAIQDYGLRQYFGGRNDYDLGVVFPVISRDSVGSTLDLWVRMVHDKQFFRLSHDRIFCPVEYKAPHLWFGNHLVTPKTKNIFLVEGALDALRLYSLFTIHSPDWVVLASLGGPSKMQLDGFPCYTSAVYVAYDADQAGVQFAQKAASYISSHVKPPALYALDWGVAGIKDAGDLVDRAQLAEVVKKRIRLSVVEKRDPNKKRKYSRRNFREL